MRHVKVAEELKPPLDLGLVEQAEADELNCGGGLSQRMANVNMLSSFGQLCNQIDTLTEGY